MDVDGNPIGKWHGWLVLDPAFSGDFILVDSTAAARYISKYSQH